MSKQTHVQTHVRQLNKEMVESAGTRSLPSSKKAVYGDSSEIKVTDEFFETFPECSLPRIVSKNTIKMVGPHSRLRDMMAQSYPFYACTRANHARYSSVHVTFCGSSKHSL